MLPIKTLLKANFAEQVTAVGPILLQKQQRSQCRYAGRSSNTGVHPGGQHLLHDMQQISAVMPCALTSGWSMDGWQNGQGAVRWYTTIMLWSILPQKGHDATTKAAFDTVAALETFFTDPSACPSYSGCTSATAFGPELGITLSKRETLALKQKLWY